MSDKRAPVQGYSAGIPWAMHLRAYDAYCKRYGKQDALIDLEGKNCRGGFHVDELDMLIPGWRDELSELARLRAELSILQAALEQATKERDEAQKVAEIRQRMIDIPTAWELTLATPMTPVPHETDLRERLTDEVLREAVNVFLNQAYTSEASVVKAACEAMRAVLVSALAPLVATDEPEVEVRLKDVVCPQCRKEFQLTWNDWSDKKATLEIRGCPSGGIYDVAIGCPHCDYEEQL